MKKAIFVLLLMNSAASASSVDFCETQPSDIRLRRGQISPAEAHRILADSDQPELAEALRLGLEIQRSGNESMIYALDALVFIAEGSGSDPRSLKAGLYSTLKRVIQNEREHYTRFQYLTGIRMAGVLGVMERTQEAARLLVYIRDGGDPARIHELRSLMSNTGRFNSSSDSIRFCKIVGGL